MTATIRLFVAIFITTALAGAAGANDDLPPQGGPLLQGVPTDTPSKSPSYTAALTAYSSAVNDELHEKIRGYEEKSGQERIHETASFSAYIDVAASGRVERVIITSGPKDSAFQQLFTKVVGPQLPPLPPSLGPSHRIELRIVWTPVNRWN